MVSAGGAHTLALQSDGTVLAWGSNSNGQLGNGQASFSDVPLIVPGISQVKAISLGDQFMLVVKQDGTVWGWGANSSGQLGDGTTTNQSSPVQTQGMSGVIAVSGGGSTSYALKGDGTVWAWGYNGGGELGNGPSQTNQFSNVPPTQVQSLAGVTAIAAGENHVLTLKDDGTVWAWGNNAYGELGIGSTTPQSTPVQVPALAGVVAIAAGGGVSLALKSDGTVWEWGTTGLINGAATARTSPVQTMGLSGVAAIYCWSGGTSFIALKTDGTVWNWTAGTAPAAVRGASGILAVAQGAGTLLLTASHTIVGYANPNQYGQLGSGNLNATENLTPVVGLTNVTAIAMGVFFSAAVTSDGSVWAWGSDVSGQLGQGAVKNVSVPQVVPGLTGVVQVAAGNHFSLALKQDGTVWAWGGNDNNAIGNGTNTDQPSPIQVQGISGVVAIAAGVSSFAVKSDGTLWAWGSNFYGEIGVPASVIPNRPVPVPGLSSVVAVASSTHTLALKQDGTVWAWGQNESGELGRGTTDAFISNPFNNPTATNWVPMQVPGLPSIRAIGVGEADSYAVAAADGSVWAWGMGGATNQASYVGAIGDGAEITRLSPVKVSGLTGATSVGGGNGAAFALLGDGSVWGWGLDPYGQLGLLPSGKSDVPVPISGFSGITQLSVGSDFIAAVKPDGSVNVAGDNSAGELGDGTFAQRSSPVLAVNTTASGYLDLIVGQAPQVSAAQAVPFFVVSTGGITPTSATVATTVKYNAGDQGKMGSVYITAVVPPGSPLLASAARYTAEAASPLSSAASSLIQLTPSGWQPVVNNQLTPYTTGVLGAASAALQILNGTATGSLPGAQFCVGYSTGTASTTTAVASRSVATIPAAATTGVAASTTTCVSAGAAIVPQGGYWWNPAEGGRGYTIEQNTASGNVFFATYLYTANGSPVWYAAGPAPMSGSTFSAPLEAFSGGQTLTGSYHAPTQGASPGNVSITFTDATDATLTWPEGTIPITRYAIVPGGMTATPPATQPQAGYWWNPAEGGRGYTIEVQSNMAFIAAYMYDSSGNAVWYAAGPAALTGNNAYVGNWTTYTGGQTLTGSYHAPTGTANAGSLTVQFSSPTAATLTLPDGRQIPIQRYSF
jgi:alpha-tubulin suppressor-like RCC1 family protein